MLSKIAGMVFPLVLHLQSRIQRGMNMQNWPGYNFCRSACINTVHYLAADWVWVAPHPFGNFRGFSAGDFDQKPLKNLLYIPHPEAAAFQEWSHTQSRTPLFSRHPHLPGTAGPLG